MGKSDEKSAGLTAGSNLIRPNELQEIEAERERQEIKAAEERMTKQEAEQKELHTHFLERQLHPEAEQRFSDAVRRAARAGQKELLILRFPAKWCADHGRAINNFEPDWPSSLTGFAQEIYQAYDTKLRPLGYRLEARVLDYPGGMPGDIGLFARW